MEVKQYDTKQPMDHWRNQKGNLEVPRDKWKWIYNDPKLMGCSKSTSKREVYSNISLPQEIRKILKNLNLHLKQLEKEQTVPKVMEGNKSLRSEQKWNRDLKKQIEMINKTKSWFFEKIKKLINL